MEINDQMMILMIGAGWFLGFLLGAFIASWIVKKIRFRFVISNVRHLAGNATPFDRWILEKERRVKNLISRIKLKRKMKRIKMQQSTKVHAKGTVTGESTKKVEFTEEPESKRNFVRQ